MLYGHFWGNFALKDMFQIDIVILNSLQLLYFSDTVVQRVAQNDTYVDAIYLM